MKRRHCGFTLPMFETFCVRSAGHLGRHVDAYRRSIEQCPEIHHRHGVQCALPVRHKGPHTADRFTWSNVR